MPLPFGLAIMVKVGTDRLVHLLITQVLFLVVPIELVWQHLKKDEIFGRMFDDELDASFIAYGSITSYFY